MDPMVSARVPLGLRDSVNQELKKIGSSPTELINSAYEYFLANHALPKKENALEPGKRHLNKEKRAELVESIAASSQPIPESFFGDSSYDEILARNLRNNYEALS